MPRSTPCNDRVDQALRREGALPGMMYIRDRRDAGVNPLPAERLWGAAPTLILVFATINSGARVGVDSVARRRHRQEQ